MDDQAALLARRVALAAAAWFNAPADVEAYRRLATAVGEWNAYCAPTLGPATSGSVEDQELLDELGADEPPMPLGAGVADLGASLRRRARQALPPHSPAADGTGQPGT